MNLEVISDFLDLLLMLLAYLAIVVFLIFRLMELYKSKTIFFCDYNRIHERFKKLMETSDNYELEKEMNSFFLSGRKKIVIDQEEFANDQAKVNELYAKLKEETNLNCEVCEFLIDQMNYQDSNKNYLHISKHKLSKTEKDILNNIF